ncbi:MAG: oligosaccharide flippase family protein [Eubacteriales bacterium]|nr:oligosaccharide flippase family protein [Christensenellaceae bacterium]MDY2750673.1 oligosaccharide flippase family protein [Eubacteriales bacterium]
MKKRTMAGNAALLAIFSVIAKAISGCYRVPLTGILGAEGMGMYQLVFSIYALILAFTTGGIPVAVSRLTSERAVLEKDSRPVLKSALVCVSVLSVSLSLILAFVRRYVAALQGNPEIADAYLLIVPSIVFTGALSMYRGWFQGNNDVVPSAVSGVVEQVAKLAAGITLAYLLAPRGALYAVYGAFMGLAVSEAAALLYIIISYFVRVRKNIPVRLDDERFSENCKSMVKTSAIFAFAGFIIPFSQFTDGILIVNLLKSIGSSASKATAAYGIFSGTVMSVINMPVVLTLSLAAALVPVISASRIKRQTGEIISKSNTSIKIAFAAGLPAAALIFVFAEPVVTLLYPRLSATETVTAIRLMIICSFSIPLCAAREIFSAILMTLDKTGRVIANNVFAVVLKTAVSVFLILRTGIEGAAYGLIVFGAAGFILNASTYVSLVGKNLKLIKNVSTTAVGSAIMAGVATLMLTIIPNSLAALAAGALTSVAAYFIVLSATRVFDDGELNGIPLSRCFDRFSKKLRFWER